MQFSQTHFQASRCMSSWCPYPCMHYQRHRLARTFLFGTNVLRSFVISASLGAIPVRDRASARKVFSTFALVAEDTFVPLSAFRILLSAVTGEAELVPELQIRKWMQILINRSIVIGTWERPQLVSERLLPAASCVMFALPLS